MLKRHLMTHYNMTPDEYRQKWGLNADYPMVAPNYAEQRRTLAKKIGLGTKRRRTQPQISGAGASSNGAALAPVGGGVLNRNPTAAPCARSARWTFATRRSLGRLAEPVRNDSGASLFESVHDLL